MRRRRPARIRRRLAAPAFLAACAAFAVLGFAAVAAARPGGGESYGGGGHSGGGGGGGELIFFVLRVWIQFCIAYPQLGIPITVVVLVLWLRAKRAHPSSNEHWDTRSAVSPPARAASWDLDRIRGLDPEFSVVLFEDFAYALYARAHESRADPMALAALAPYLSAAARSHLASRRPVGAPVEGVVIGAMRVVDLSLPAAAVAAVAAVAAAAARPQIGLALEIEANMTVGSGAAQTTQYVRERWRLVRDAAARSRPPASVGAFHCPHCGAPFADTGGGRCQYCGEVVTDGRFDWSAQSIEALEVEERPPALAGSTPEQGTDFPTVFHPALAARRAELLRDDPATTDAALAERLRLVYDRLNAAWTGLDLAPARPYVSDRLFEYLQYWISAYKAQGLRNVLAAMRMTDAKLVKAIHDRHYDSLTFRIWGTGRDSTVRQATGEVVAGDPEADRAYSEYWTLIRGAGVRGAPRADAACPNCGAPLAVNMAGHCEHCGALITRGDFDWVLSKIEQDDSYSG